MRLLTINTLLTGFLCLAGTLALAYKIYHNAALDHEAGLMWFLAMAGVLKLLAFGQFSRRSQLGLLLFAVSEILLSLSLLGAGFPFGPVLALVNLLAGLLVFRAYARLLGFDWDHFREQMR